VRDPIACCAPAAVRADDHGRSVAILVHSLEQDPEALDVVVEHVDAIEVAVVAAFVHSVVGFARRDREQARLEFPDILGGHPERDRVAADPGESVKMASRIGNPIRVFSQTRSEAFRRVGSNRGITVSCRDRMAVCS